MDGDDLEELDLRWQVAMLTVRVKKFIQRTGRNMDFKEKRHVSLDKSKIECYNCHRKGHFARECRSGRSQGRRSYGDNGRSNAPTNESSSQALVAQDGLGGYDWSNDFEVEPVNYALMAISSSSSSSSSDSENYELKCKEIKINNLYLELEKVVKERVELKDKITKWEEFTKNLEEILKSQMSARDKTSLGYSTQLNELSSNHETDSENSLSIFDGNFLTPRADISFAGLDEYAIRNKIIESQTSEINNKTSETAGKTNDANTKKPKSVSESVVSNPKINRDSVIIEDWTSDDEEEVSGVQKVRPENQTVKTRDEKMVKILINKELVLGKEGKPVWDNAKRVNHQNFSKYPHLSKTFVPSEVLTRTGFVSTARPSISTARPSISTTRPVSTARPSINTARPSISTARPVSTARPSINTARPVSTASPSINLRAFQRSLLQDHAKLSVGGIMVALAYDWQQSFIFSDYEGFQWRLYGFWKCDNGTEFKNYVMNEFCAKKGIKREFSVARTPQQNGVAERKNRTLIEAARNYVRSPTFTYPFLANAGQLIIDLLCTESGILVTKPQNKTPYELITGKFDGKSDEERFHKDSYVAGITIPMLVLCCLPQVQLADSSTNGTTLLSVTIPTLRFQVTPKASHLHAVKRIFRYLKHQPKLGLWYPRDSLFELEAFSDSDYARSQAWTGINNWMAL
ncbi:ribonuclease H-like domain-containing protein [Tanacetum coccineum]